MLALLNRVILLLLLLISLNSHSLDRLEDLTDLQIQEAALAFINLTTSPGIEGLNLSLAQPQRESSIARSSLGFSADFSLRDWPVDGHWGAALIQGQLDEGLMFIGRNDVPVLLAVDRDIMGIRGSFGVVIPITEHFKLRPFVSAIYTQTETFSYLIEGRANVDVHFPTDKPEFLTHFSSTGMTGSLQAEYKHWIKRRYRTQFLAHYNLNYSDTHSQEFEHLNTWGWSQTLVLKSEISTKLNWHSFNRPWRVKAYLNYHDFINQSELALGFTHYFELGGGMSWEWNIKPLDWFGLKSVGLSAGLIFGDTLEGFNIGLTGQ